MIEPPKIASPGSSARVRVEADEPAESAPFALTNERTRGLSSFFISLTIHVIAITILAIVGVRQNLPAAMLGVTIAPGSADEESAALVQTPAVEPLLRNAKASGEPEVTPQFASSPDAPDIPSPLLGPSLGVRPALPSEDALRIPRDSLLLSTGVAIGGGLEGRTIQERARLAGLRGGNAASESAVELGLSWLAAHQRQDGGWRLDHQDGPCQGRCGNPGTAGTSTGATSLALLSFLGAGYTHTQGPYQSAIKDGLDYLVARMKNTPHGGDLQEGTMYAQGLSAMTLCEAYAMTGDQNLGGKAQKAIDFICEAQHPRGGWRYNPGQPGDTTVTGWQIMALKSARLVRLSIPSPIIERSKGYLDGVQDGGGSYYGYQRPNKEPACTAVGLLCRMYLGWRRDDPRLVRGVKYLSNLGPSPNDMYFNFYATQVLCHHDGNEWPGWNKRMRDFLVAKQATTGHEKGSWYFPDRHGTIGGRLYTTAMCVMILEVYYRYLPLYGNRSVDDDF